MAVVDPTVRGATPSLHDALASVALPCVSPDPVTTLRLPFVGCTCCGGTRTFPHGQKFPTRYRPSEPIRGMRSGGSCTRFPLYDCVRSYRTLNPNPNGNLNPNPNPTGSGAGPPAVGAAHALCTVQQSVISNRHAHACGNRSLEQEGEGRSCSACQKAATGSPNLNVHYTATSNMASTPART